MVKKFLTFFLILSLNNSYSQNYKKIDDRIKQYPYFNTIENLVIRIKNDFSSKDEQVRAVFTWIANNIKYDTSYNKIKATEQLIFLSEKDKKRKKEKLILEKIDKAIKTKKATCDGYTLLFKKLCDILNIESKIVSGYTKTDTKNIGINRAFKDHSWNSIFLNNTWRLLDVTWAAGYQDLSTKKFIKAFNDYYYFTKPEEFINHHLPGDSKWQLLENKITKETFFSKPILYSSYFKSGFELSNNYKGIIKVKKGEKHIILYFNKVPKDFTAHYIYENDKYARELKIKKSLNGGYYSKLKFKENQDSNLTIFNNLKAIASFKIVIEKTEL